MKEYDIIVIGAGSGGKTRLQWVVIRILYKWGISPFILAKWYKDIR